MKRPSREEYERAVALARAAIRARKDRPRIRADRTPNAVLAKMKAKAERGDTLTEADQGALMAALAEVTTPKKRGRGRPRGTRDHAAHAAFFAAAAATESVTLHTYRNEATRHHEFSQCDAIAAAMKAEGHTTLATYNAAENEMKAIRRTLKSAMKVLRGALAGMAQQWQAMARISNLFEPFARQMQEQGRAASAALGRIQRQVEGIEQVGKALGQRIRTQTALSPETRRAIKRRMKTMR